MVEWGCTGSRETTLGCGWCQLVGVTKVMDVSGDSSWGRRFLLCGVTVGGGAMAHLGETIVGDWGLVKFYLGDVESRRCIL